MTSNANFNPYDPHSLGLQWAPIVEGAARVAEADTVGIPGVLLTATATEIIRWIYPAVIRSSPQGAQGQWLVEIWDVDNIGDATITERTFYPDEDAYNGDAWALLGGSETQTDIYRAIDNASLTPGTWPNSGNPVTDNSFLFPIFGSGYEAAFRFSGIAGTYASGTQITGVTLWANIQNFIDLGANGPMTIQPYLYIGATKYTGDPVDINSIDGATEVTFTWQVNPASGAPWTPATLAQLDSSGGAYRAGWIVSPTNSSNNLATIMQGQLRITDAGADVREAFGVIPGSRTVRNTGWVPTPLATPTGGLWTKEADKTYLITIRKTAGGGWLTWKYLQNPDQNVQALPVQAGTSIALGPESLRPTNTVFATDPTIGYAYLLRRTNGANATSLDSQPYASANDDAPGPPSKPVAIVTKRAFWTRVHSANGSNNQGDAFVEQEFTPVLTTTYGYMRALVRLVRAGNGVLLEDDVPRLVLRIFDRATDTQQGGTVFIYPSDLTPDRETFQIIGKEIPNPPTLDAGTQYYVKVTTAARVTLFGSWAIQVASDVPFSATNPPPADTGVATWGGDTDAYSRIPPSNPLGGRYTGLDAVLTVHTQPDAPENFSVVATAPPVSASPCPTGNSDDVVNYVDLAWDPTSISVNEGGGFSHYQIQRDDGDGRGWFDIAIIDDQTCNTMPDHEARVGCAVRYRMRVVRVDGSPSAWVTDDAVTLEMVAGGYVFTSNFVPDRRLWYADENPREFEFPETAVNRQFYGENGSVTYRELEDRLDVLQGTLLVRSVDYRCAALETSGCPVSQVGRQVFQPLLELVGNKIVPSLGAKLTLPYVCIRDRWGNRWFSSVTIASGTITSNKIYLTDFNAIETTRNPAPVDRTCTVAGSGSGSGEVLCSLLVDYFNAGGSGSGSGSSQYQLGTLTTGEAWLFERSAAEPVRWRKFSPDTEAGVWTPTGGTQVAYRDVVSANHFAAATFPDGVTGQVGLIVRFDDIDNYLAATFDPSGGGTATLTEVVAGAPNVLDTDAFVVDPDDQYLLEVEGTTVTLSGSGATILTGVTAVGGAGALGVGMIADASTDVADRWDTFVGGCL